MTFFGCLKHAAIELTAQELLHMTRVLGRTLSLHTLHLMSEFCLRMRQSIMTSFGCLKHAVFEPTAQILLHVV